MCGCGRQDIHSFVIERCCLDALRSHLFVVLDLTPKLLLVVPIGGPGEAINAGIAAFLEIVKVQSPPGPAAGQLASHLERHSALGGSLGRNCGGYGRGRRRCL